MPNPLERLTKILAGHTPATVKFRRNTGHTNPNIIYLDSVIVKASETVPPPEDKELFELLKSNIYESWDSDNNKYTITTTVDSLWRNILTVLISRYDNTSARCAATKRKTTNFIEKIKINDKLLSEFILQTFIRVQSSSYKNVSTKDRETLFEQFDSLRRTFGKRV